MARGFKMKHGAIKIGHNGQIKPITSRFAGDGHGTPLHQDQQFTDETTNITGTANPTSYVVSGVNPGTVEAKYVPATGGSTSFTGMNDACSEEYIAANGPEACKKLEGQMADDPCFGRGYEKCSDGSSPVAIDGECKCLDQEAGPDQDVSMSVSGDVDTPGFNVLTPHLARRNMRMISGSGRQLHRQINAANRRVRKAIRRGKPPSNTDMQILSGVTDTGWEGFDPNTMTAGGASLMGYRYKPHHGEASTRALTGDQIKNLVKAEMAANKGMREDEAAAIIQAQIDAGQYGGGSRSPQVEAGKFLDDRTKKLMKRRGYDIPGGQIVTKRNKNRLDQGGEGTAVGNLLRGAVSKIKNKKNPKKRKHGGEGTAVGNLIRKTVGKIKKKKKK